MKVLYTPAAQPPNALVGVRMEEGEVMPVTLVDQGALPYTPATPGNWNPAPSTLAAALDALAAPNSAKQLDAGQGAAGAITLTAVAITKAKSGLVLVMADFTYTVSAANTATITLQRDGVNIVGAPALAPVVANASTVCHSMLWLDVLPDTAAHNYSLRIAVSSGTVTTAAGASGMAVVEFG